MPKRKRPVLGIDYIIDGDGRAQFTAEFLLKRGYCCEHECRYCPFLMVGSATHFSSNEQTTSASGGCTGSQSGNALAVLH